MIKSVFSFLFIIFCLTGCSTLAPDYSRPDAPVPDEWPQGEAYENTQAVSEAVKIPELSRQEFFTDEQLQKIIEMALDNNRDLRLAALNVEKARALYGVARAELAPVVNATATGKKESTPGIIFGDIGKDIGSLRTETYSVGLGIAA